MSDVLKELRSAVNATTSTPGVDPGFNSATIDAVITKKIADLSPKFSELYNMTPKASLNGQGSKIWVVNVEDNESTRWGYSYSESSVTQNVNSNTPGATKKQQLTAVPKTVRNDWQVENFYRDISASFYDAINNELNNSVETMIDKIERQLVLGTAGGDADGYLGLKQLVSSNAIGDTSTVFGIQRSGSTSYMDCQIVDADGAAFNITMLDAARTALRKQRAKLAFFLVSYERADEINAQLQVQQRFQGSMTIEGGFEVPTYLGIPIISNNYMSTAGPANTDTVIFGMGTDNWFLYETNPIRSREATLGREDSVGGFLVHYAVPVIPRLTHNVRIHDLAVPNVA